MNREQKSPFSFLQKCILYLLYLAKCPGPRTTQPFLWTFFFNDYYRPINLDGLSSSRGPAGYQKVSVVLKEKDPNVLLRDEGSSLPSPYYIRHGALHPIKQ
jgi:hypothetical protein